MPVGCCHRNGSPNSKRELGEFFYIKVMKSSNNKRKLMECKKL